MGDGQSSRLVVDQIGALTRSYHTHARSSSDKFKRRVDLSCTRTRQERVRAYVMHSLSRSHQLWDPSSTCRAMCAMCAGRHTTTRAVCAAALRLQPWAPGHGFRHMLHTFCHNQRLALRYIAHPPPHCFSAQICYVTYIELYGQPGNSEGDQIWISVMHSGANQRRTPCGEQEQAIKGMLQQQECMHAKVPTR